MDRSNLSIFNLVSIFLIQNFILIIKIKKKKWEAGNEKF